MPKEKNDSITLSKDQIKAITETAAAVAVREYLKEAERDRQERKDHRLHNTRLLMENLRWMENVRSLHEKLELIGDLFCTIQTTNLHNADFRHQSAGFPAVETG